MSKPNLRIGRLTGERGLLVAVIARAVRDAAKEEPDGHNTTVEDVADARAYFAGEEYRTHLELLDLPRTYIPQEFLQHE